MAHHHANVLGHILLVQCQGPISSGLHKCIYVADYSKDISDNACSRVYVMCFLVSYRHVHQFSLDVIAVKQNSSLDAQCAARPSDPITPIKDIVWSHI